MTGIVELMKSSAITADWTIGGLVATASAEKASPRPGMGSSGAVEEKSDGAAEHARAATWSRATAEWRSEATESRTDPLAVGSNSLKSRKTPLETRSGPLTATTDPSKGTSGAAS